ncbi:phage tail protein [Tissierella sp. MSJ-40]|uniref:Phage tail protein n=1 Tax=Tissierella simiarum TaxID=2841534 RepID=A0ABS6E7S3_9FIRM|nr:phage tail protein [Tissierella simiarum]MBU5438294.1 phage tail protein [Tissierella simiarum]
MIEITNEQIERVNLILGGIKNAPNKAFYNTINRALMTVRSKSGKMIRETYRIKQSDITSNQNMKLKRASMRNLEGQIEFAGSVIPLIKFKVTPSEPKRKTVSVSVLRTEGGKRLQSAYVANLGRYGAGVFERMTSKRETSQQLFGPSTAHMMGNAGVIQKVEAAAQETIDKRIEHEISRILNGYV